MFRCLHFKKIPDRLFKRVIKLAVVINMIFLPNTNYFVYTYFLLRRLSHSSNLTISAIFCRRSSYGASQGRFFRIFSITQKFLVIVEASLKGACGHTNVFFGCCVVSCGYNGLVNQIYGKTGFLGEDICRTTHVNITMALSV